MNISTHKIQISMLNLSSLWVGAFMVAVPQQESWHSVLSLDIRFQQNECFEMLNNERGICMFKLSLTNNCYNEWFELIEQILNVLFKYKPKKKMHDYKTWFPKMGYFHLECQNLIKTSNNVIFLHPCLLFLSKILECNFVIIKMRLIIFINVTFCMKKIKILASISQNLVIYHTTNICHHIEHNLFYL
jgi:hypothetical protein